MEKSEQITIEKKELPELKKFLKKKHKKISKITRLKKKGIRVMIEDNLELNEKTKKELDRKSTRTFL